MSGPLVRPLQAPERARRSTPNNQTASLDASWFSLPCRAEMRTYSSWKIVLPPRGQTFYAGTPGSLERWRLRPSSRTCNVSDDEVCWCGRAMVSHSGWCNSTEQQHLRGWRPLAVGSSDWRLERPAAPSIPTLFGRRAWRSIPGGATERLVASRRCLAVSSAAARAASP